MTAGAVQLQNKSFFESSKSIDYHPINVFSIRNF